MSDTGFLFTITMGKDRYRLVSRDALPEARLPNGAVIREELWRTSFRVHHRQVPCYQHGRVYLAGDAAHVHSPIGARGMNMGIADAATLAWLLSEQHEAEYSAIRHPVGKRTIAMVRRQTLQAVSATRWRRRLAGVVVIWISNETTSLASKTVTDLRLINTSQFCPVLFLLHVTQKRLGCFFLKKKHLEVVEYGELRRG